YRRLADAAAGKARVRMSSPVRFEDARGRNIVAAWNGDGGDFRPTLAFIAHYDHMGTDADGSRFPGALDNASGTALAVRLAEAIALGSTRADFALVLTDGEEVNLGGAWALARDPPFPLRGVSVVNLDMVGSRADMELSVFHNGDPASRQLADRIAEVVREAGFTAVLRSPVYNLDHGHLPRAGARAVSVCEFDTSFYHTKEDLPGILSASELSVLGGALLRFALEELESR
ncbi:MAG TPA: M28 family peptidase, partial [Spirochaetia bacterium]|nr:M28 family peptidase [Spirochaetia bacterium]